MSFPCVYEIAEDLDGTVEGCNWPGSRQLLKLKVEASQSTGITTQGSPACSSPCTSFEDDEQTCGQGGRGFVRRHECMNAGGTTKQTPVPSQRMNLQSYVPCMDTPASRFLGLSRSAEKSCTAVQCFGCRPTENSWDCCTGAWPGATPIGCQPTENSWDCRRVARSDSYRLM